MTETAAVERVTRVLKQEEGWSWAYESKLQDGSWNFWVDEEKTIESIIAAIRKEFNLCQD